MIWDDFQKIGKVVRQKPFKIRKSTRSLGSDLDVHLRHIIVSSVRQQRPQLTGSCDWVGTISLISESNGAFTHAVNSSKHDKPKGMERFSIPPVWWLGIQFRIQDSATYTCHLTPSGQYSRRGYQDSPEAHHGARIASFNK